MSQDNALLKPQSTPSASRGIHLVYSRTWQIEDPRRLTLAARTQMPQARPVRESHAMANLSLGIAAISAPLIWVGHAILRWMHIL